jgi:hypothetical protein
MLMCNAFLLLPVFQSWTEIVHGREVQDLAALFWDLTIHVCMKAVGHTVDGISLAVPSAEHPPAWKQIRLQLATVIFKGERSLCFCVLLWLCYIIVYGTTIPSAAFL